MDDDEVVTGRRSVRSHRRPIADVATFTGIDQA